METKFDPLTLLRKASLVPGLHIVEAEKLLLDSVFSQSMLNVSMCTTKGLTATPDRSLVAQFPLQHLIEIYFGSFYQMVRAQS